MRHELAALRARLARHGCPVPENTSRVGEFGDGPELSARLLDLVGRGEKTATSSLLWEFEAEGEPVPETGATEILVSWDGAPVGVIEYTWVQVLPFREVPEEFARDEGEGDRSLDHWRRVHWEFFSRRCRELERVPDDRMPIVCARFRLLHWVRPDPRIS